MILCRIMYRPTNEKQSFLNEKFQQNNCESKGVSNGSCKSATTDETYASRSTPDSSILSKHFLSSQFIQDTSHCITFLNICKQLFLFWKYFYAFVVFFSFPNHPPFHLRIRANRVRIGDKSPLKNSPIVGEISFVF